MWNGNLLGAWLLVDSNFYPCINLLEGSVLVFNQKMRLPLGINDVKSSSCLLSLHLPITICLSDE